MDPIKGMICKKYKCEADAKMSVSLAKFKESIQPQLASIRKNILKERERVKKLQDELLNGYIQVYTDGSCFDNGELYAKAGMGIYWGENHPMNTAKPVRGNATSSRGELQAAILAIKQAKEMGIERLCINCDSHYVLNIATKWRFPWKRNNWCVLGKNVEVKNIDNVIELDECLAETDIDIKWNYVPAHSNIIGNDKADELAKQGAKLYGKKEEE